jgi:hypothetical protein
MEDVNRSGVLFQSAYIASPSTPHRDEADSAGSGFDLGAVELVRRGTVMPVIPPERLDALGNLTNTVSLFRFLRP